MHEIKQNDARGVQSVTRRVQKQNKGGVGLKGNEPGRFVGCWVGSWAAI